jgi:hypothetical protein
MRLALSAAAAVLALALAGCAAQAPPDTPTASLEGPVASLKIARAHYPPPGRCRVWHPGQPVEEQPEPTPCYALQGNVPLGAWVLYRPAREERLIEVTAYDPIAPKRVSWVRYFEVETGQFVHEVLAN